MTPGHPSAEHANLSLKRTIDALRPRAVPYRVWDSKLPGFGVFVSPSGRRSYLVMYRAAGRKRAMFLRGDSRTLAPAAARKLAAAALAAVAEGRDPLDERRAAAVAGRDEARARRAAPTVADVAARYIRTLELTKSARWAAEARRILDKHIDPALGTRKVADVAVQDVRAIHEKLHRTPALANRTRAVLAAILSRAVADGARAPGTNPAAAVERYAEEPRARYLDASEWKRLGEAMTAERAALADAGAEDTRPAQLDAITLLALTGARMEAVTRRRWADVDYEARVLRIVPSHKGTSAVYLGEPALALLRTWHATRGKASPFVFPGAPRREGRQTARGARDTRPRRPPRCISGVYVAWGGLCERAKLRDLHIHDLRRSFATAAGDVNVSSHLIGGLLGHRVPGITNVYAKRSDPALADAANRTAAEVALRLNLANLADPQILPMAGRGR